MQRQLEFAIRIAQPVALVYAHLAVPANFLGLQPLLVEVSAVHETLEDGKTLLSYESVELFRWLGLPLLRNRIRVRTVLLEPPYRMQSTVYSLPQIRLDVLYQFTPQGQATLLQERMTIHVHPLLAGFVVNQATQAQQQVLQNLKQRLERTLAC